MFLYQKPTIFCWGIVSRDLMCLSNPDWSERTRSPPILLSAIMLPNPKKPHVYKSAFPSIGILVGVLAVVAVVAAVVVVVIVE